MTQRGVALGSAKGSRGLGIRVSFIEWVDATGVEKIAEKLRVSTNTVRNWRQGVCDPRVEQMRQIRRWTKGAVTYESIIDRPRTPRGPRPTFLVVT